MKMLEFFLQYHEGSLPFDVAGNIHHLIQIAPAMARPHMLTLATAFLDTIANICTWILGLFPSIAVTIAIHVCN